MHAHAHSALTGDVCLGLAVVSGVDLGACATPSADAGNGSGTPGHHRGDSTTPPPTTASPGSGSGSTAGPSGTCVLSANPASSSTPLTGTPGIVGAATLAGAALLRRRRPRVIAG